MSRKLRFLPSGVAMVEVTCRTVQGRLLLSPPPHSRRAGEEEANARGDFRRVVGDGGEAGNGGADFSEVEAPAAEDGRSLARV
jgi:hypothetical protein